jgi:aryl-alcohol dehydrogenase-like predicted oxidoreductase
MLKRIVRPCAKFSQFFDGPANFLDTSRIYGFGRSEARIGKVVRERGGLPSCFIVSTKLDRDADSVDPNVWRTRRHGRWPIPEGLWEKLVSIPFSMDDPEATRTYCAG